MKGLILKENYSLVHISLLQGSYLKAVCWMLPVVVPLIQVTCVCDVNLLSAPLFCLSPESSTWVPFGKGESYYFSCCLKGGVHQAGIWMHSEWELCFQPP